ncbi:MAG: hypothetical protein ABIO67_01320 [Mycobacteriales bacterium]
MTGLLMGVGAADITPTEAVRLAGFLGRQPAVPPLDVADPLGIRVVAVREGASTALLVVADLVGMSAVVSSQVRLAVSSSTGVPVEGVLTSCTHTHSGPDTLLGMDLYEAYVPWLVGQATAAAHQALASLVEVSLGYAEIDVPPDLAVNRRGVAHRSTLQLLDVHSAAGRLACVVGVGIHPVTHGPDVHVITADWVGHCRRAVERALGGSCVVVAGALGDVNPPGGQGYERAGGGVDLARSVGDAVAGLATRAAVQTEALGAGLALQHRTIELPVADSETSRLVSFGSDVVLTELFDWDLGGLRLRSLPGEPLSGFVDALPTPGPTMTVGLAPSWQGYLPHPDQLAGGYEDELGLGAPAMRLLLEALGAT